MHSSNRDSHVIVSVSWEDVKQFKARWPGSQMPLDSFGVVFEPNGDLVDFLADTDRMLAYLEGDSDDVRAIVEMAQEYAEQKGHLRRRNPDRGRGSDHDPFTEKQARAVIRMMGFSVSKRDGEIRVAPNDDWLSAAQKEAQAYYTDDWTDAVLTAEAMAGRRRGYDSKHRRNPHYETLEPDWHGMGQWALSGLRFHISEHGKVKARSKRDKKSVIALLAVASSCAFYVHDIATELSILCGIDDSMTGPATKEDVEHEAVSILSGHGSWKELFLVMGECGEGWGAVANALNESLETAGG